MSTPSKFLATRLWDEDYKFGISYHEVDLSTRESIIQAAENIKKENHTPEQISGILGVILKAAKEKLTEEDLNTVFQGVTEAVDDEPYTIALDSENRPLIYSALRELLSSSEETETEDSINKKLEEAYEELSRLQCTNESIVPYQNFTIAEDETEWDESKAKEQIKEKATDSEGNIDWNTYRKVFLYCNTSKAESEGAYKFPIAYSEDGYKVVPKALEAAANYLSKAKIPAEAKEAIKEQLRKYYKKMDKDLPDSLENEEFDEEVIKTEVETRLEAAILEKTQELETALAETKEKVSTLEKALLKLSTDKHEMLAKEAALVAIKSGYPAAKGKSFESLVASFVVRSTDSLEDLIKDLLPIENTDSNTTFTTPDIDPDKVEKVDNPTTPVETALPEQMTEDPVPNAVPGETTLQTQLFNQVEEEDEDKKETYLLLNFSPKESEDLKSRIAKVKRGVLGSE